MDLQFEFTQLIQAKPGWTPGSQLGWGLLYMISLWGQTGEAVATWGGWGGALLMALLIRQANHIKPFQTNIPLDKRSHMAKSNTNGGRKYSLLTVGSFAKLQLQGSDKLGKIIQYTTPSLDLSFPFVKIRELNQFLQGQFQLCHFIILTCVLTYSFNKHFLITMHQVHAGDKMMSKK